MPTGNCQQHSKDLIAILNWHSELDEISIKEVQIMVIKSMFYGLWKNQSRFTSETHSVNTGQVIIIKTTTAPNRIDGWNDIRRTWRSAVQEHPLLKYTCLSTLHSDFPRLSWPTCAEYLHVQNNLLWNWKNLQTSSVFCFLWRPFLLYFIVVSGISPLKSNLICHMHIENQHAE